MTNSEQARRRRLVPAFVLHTRPYRNTSLILDVFTEAHGRAGIVARGARAGKRARSGLLQAFQPLLLSWSGRGELGTLTGVEAAGRALVPKGRRLYSGLYINELVVRFLHRDDPHPELFAHYREALRALAGDEDEEIAIRRFEVQLLQEMGYGLIVDHEARSGEAIEADRRYAYQLEAGPVYLRDGDAEADNVTVVSGATLLALRDGRLEGEQVRREARRLLRQLIAHHLGGRPVQSRLLFTAASYTE